MKILANRVYTDSTLKKWSKEDLIEQIRILEHNWSCAEENFNNSVKNSDKIFAEQKAEIERLTEKVENQKAVIKGQNKTIEKEKAENKRLYNEYVRLDDFCAGKGCICCVCENKKTCNECKTCGSLATEKCNNFKIDVSKYTRAIERAGKLQKQAVKDTAKEILQEIGAEACEHAYVNRDCEWFERICKKYGVEGER